MAILRTALMALLLAGLAAAAPAQETGAPTDEGSAPIPPFLDAGAPAGAELAMRTDRTFDRYDLPVGPQSRGETRLRGVEGRVIRSAWRLAEAQATTAAVMAGYRERLAGLGYEPLFSCTADDCGGIDFRFAVELLPPPAMLVDAADFAQLSARRPGAEEEAGENAGDNTGASYFSVLVSRLLGAVYVQTVAVAPAAPEVPLAPAPVVGAGAEAAPAVSDAAAGLIEPLLAFGHARLHGLDFEPGSAALTPGSAASLDRAAEALAARPELRLMIVGHSDNQGALEDNVALSRRRAEAVREALVERGVEAARLEARGAGFLAPVASNASEQGRALNRRVELVLR